MSAAGEAKAKEDAFVSGAKPRLEERVRERGWRPRNECLEIVANRTKAARRRAIARGRRANVEQAPTHEEAA